MSTEPTTSRGQTLLQNVSQALDWAAPAVALAVTAALVLERTPKREPLLYGAIIGILIALMWASARARGHYGLWALYITSFALFGVARSFADETGIPTHVGELVEADKTLAFGTVPTVWLQNQLFDPHQIGWLDRATAYVHWSYFVMPHLFAAHLFLGHRHLFERYVMVFVGVLVVGLLIYFLFPAAPPWVASLTGNLDPTYKIVTEVGSEFNVNLYTRFESQIRSSNPVAAMPSLHMAVTVVIMLMAWRASPALGIIATAYNAAMAFALVYAAEHYVIDIIAGALVSVVVYVAIEAWFRYRDRRGRALLGDELIEAGPLSRQPPPQPDASG